jgi:hypothetical protein
MGRNKTPFRGWTRASGAGVFLSMKDAVLEIPHKISVTVGTAPPCPPEGGYISFIN